MIGVAVLQLCIVALCWSEPRTHPVHQPKYDWYQAGGLLRPVQRLDSKPVCASLPVCIISYRFDSQFLSSNQCFWIFG